MNPTGAQPPDDVTSPLRIVPLESEDDRGFGRRLGVVVLLLMLGAAVGAVVVLPRVTISTTVSMSGSLDPLRAGAEEACEPVGPAPDGVEAPTCRGRLLLSGAEAGRLAPGDRLRLSAAHTESTVHAEVEQVEAAGGGATPAREVPVVVRFAEGQSPMAADLTRGGAVTIDVTDARAPASEVLRTWIVARVEALR